MRYFCLMLSICCQFNAAASCPEDSLRISNTDDRRSTFNVERAAQKVYGEVKKLSHVDTTYIMPQKYNFTVMIQNINTYEMYRISDNNGQHITFSSRPSVKVGPYFGWRWICLGYTIDFSHLSNGSKKQDFNLSLYSNKIGADLFYRKTGDDFRIRDIRLNNIPNAQLLNHVPFEGFKGSIKGFNIYYIFNNKRFSYPAAYSQSTVQRRSAGSLLAGIGLTKHSLAINWDKLDQLVNQRLNINNASQIVDQTLRFSDIKYYDISASVGYAYNWVFAPHFLFNASLSTALAYKKSSSGYIDEQQPHKAFSFRNFNLDGVGRFALVYNNMRWYAGTSAIFHTYNYNKSQFQTNNTFGYVTLYLGYNFGKK